MNPQLAKEIRPLLFPWMVAAAAAALHTFTSEFLFGITGFVFFGTIVVIVAMTIGTEFHHRTLGLIFTQPSERTRIWDKKLWAVVIVLGTLALLDCRFQRALRDNVPIPWFLTTITIVTVVCAAGFWLGKGHSLVAATALSLVTNLPLIASTLWAVSVWFYGRPSGIVCLGVLCLLYPMAYVMAGWNFWHNKLLPLALGVLGILTLSTLGSIGANFVQEDQGQFSIVLLTLTFFVTTACTAGFWTLAARSTIGGAAFTFCAQFALAVATIFLVHKGFGMPAEPSDLRVALALAVCGAVYSGLFLLWGRRIWSTLELRENIPGESSAAPEIPFRGFDFLRAEPRSPTLNLFRKELRLQRSLMLLAVLFTVCWLIGVAAAFFAPEIKLDALFQALFLFYAPIYLLLAGCVSLSDEQAIGTMPWHLTLPIKPWRCWAVKIATGGVIGLVLGVVLPITLVWLTHSWAHRDTGMFADVPGLVSIICFAAILYVLSFWSATLVQGTVRAALTSLVMMAAFCALYVLGANLGRHLDLPGPWLPTIILGALQTANLPWAMVHSELFLMIGVIPLAIVILWQSVVEFRRPHPKPFAIWKRTGFVAATVFLVPLLMTGLIVSANRAHQQMQTELREAAKLVIERGKELSPRETRQLTLPELAETGSLSRGTEYWLRNCRFTYHSEEVADSRGPSGRYGLGRAYLIEVSFPGEGELNEIVYALPRRIPPQESSE
jgi:hypothetical protein